MRVVVQRVKEARVTVDGRVCGEIKKGMVVLLGVGEGDDADDVNYLADRVANLRIFPDEEGKMNIAPADAEAAVLVVPQFTLYGDCHGGHRPSFIGAAPPDEARRLYRDFTSRLSEHLDEVATGEFGAMMMVDLTNWGPVTLLMDSSRDF